MSTARIGEGKGPDPSPGSTRPTTRFGAALASPLGILLIVPGLVALVGIFLTLGGDHALRGGNLAMAEERLSEQTRVVAAHVRDTLDQSGPVLDRLSLAAREHDPSRSFDSFAHTLADLMSGRPGIAYVSVSYPDGTFQGAYLDDDQVIRFQDSRVENQGSTRDRRYTLGKRGTLSFHREERTTYDPRERAFFKLAVQRGKRGWTEPYPFFRTHYTGVTRCEPVYRQVGSEKHLVAVVTVDFDVNALSNYLRGRQLPGMRALLYAGDGTLLAYPQGGAAIQQQAERPNRVLRHSDLDDPVLAAFFAGVRGVGHEQLSRVENHGEGFLVAVARASSDPALAWYVAYLVPEAYFLRGLRKYEQRSLIIGAIAVLAAMAVGLLFARHIVRVQGEATAARAEANQARRAARELGSYRLVACLGRGGMGEVWKAEHRLLAREAAIKLIKPDSDGTTGEEMRARFKREAETLAKLRSRNTIELFDYGVSEDGTFYFVMELLDGMDLESLVLGYGPQPAARVLQLLAQACNSLAEAHDAGLVHRDIKPANLFVCRAADELDLVKVLDFGLVRAATGLSLEVSPEHSAEFQSRNAAAGLSATEPSDAADVQITQAGGLMGTPGYMAPEQALGHALDHRADLYSLGCVGFWLLSGRLVFEEDNPLRLMLAHAQQSLPQLRSRIPGFVPDELIRLITACLAKSPADRPSSARELGRSLRAVTVPPEHGWTPEHAEAWWNRYRPRRRSLRGPPDASREFNVAG